MKKLNQIKSALNSSEQLNTNATQTIKGGGCDDRKRLLTYTCGTMSVSMDLSASTGKLVQMSFGGTKEAASMTNYTVTAVNP